MKQSIKLTQGQPWKCLIRFAMPVLLGMMLQQLYNTVDTIIVGNFAGEGALSAVGASMSPIILFVAVAIGMSAGNGVVVAQHYGAGNEENVKKAAGTGMILMFIMGIVNTIFAFATCNIILKYWLKIPEHLLKASSSYFLWYSAGLIFSYGYNIISGILRALGDSKSTLYFLVIAAIINVFTDLLFVAVFKWGASGAAIATDISQAASFLAALIYMRKRYPVFRFKRKDFVYVKEMARKTVSVGFPIAFQMVMVSVGFSFLQRIVNSYGQAMIASFTVAQRFETYMGMVPYSFQMTLATFTGQNIGAGLEDRVKTGTRQTLVITFIISSILSVLCYFFADELISFFGISGEAAAYCMEHLRVTCFLILISILYSPVFGLFQGTGHSIVSTIIAIIILFVRVLTAYTLNGLEIFGYRIIWWNQAFGFACGLIITWAYYFSGKWRLNRVLK